MPESVYRIGMQGQWSLEELYTLPHAYSQNYAFVYCFDAPLEPRDAERIDYALQGYPWQGGYSYVNIYTILRTQIPKQERPQVAAIQYASPGWIDLLLNPDVAMKVAQSLGIFFATMVSATATYRKISKILQKINEERSKARNRQIQLSQQEIYELDRLTRQLAQSLGFESLDEVNARTEDPEVTTRLLMAHYRRMKQVRDFIAKGKAEFPETLRDDD